MARKAAEPRLCVICDKPLLAYQKNGCCYAHGKQALSSRFPVRHCAVCGKLLTPKQKWGCCFAHGKQALALESVRAVPADHRCVVCSTPLVKRRRESWARFAVRKRCPNPHGAKWASGKPAAAQAEGEALRRAA